MDDIRFRPADAQMTTYTYKPLAGATSESNESDLLTTYEYDEFNRLKLVRDNTGKIIRKTVYNYRR